jgi:drug/metabolite transporter (DMT)-like permease
MSPAPPSRTVVLSSWIVLLALGAVCQIALKYAGLETGPFDFSPRAFAAAAASGWLWLAVACYVGEFLSWMVILRHSSLSSAFPTGAIVLVLLMIASRFLFDEPVGWLKIVGSAMIVGGVLMLGPDHPAATPAADAAPSPPPPSGRNRS